MYIGLLIQQSDVDCPRLVSIFLALSRAFLFPYAIRHQIHCIVFVSSSLALALACMYVCLVFVDLYTQDSSLMILIQITQVLFSFGVSYLINPYTHTQGLK